MYDKTTSAYFIKYGATYEEAKDLSKENLIKKEITTSNKIISNLYNFKEASYVEVVEGMAAVLIGTSPNGKFEVFSIRRNIEIKPEMYFNIIPMTNEAKINLIIPQSYNLNLETLTTPYVYNRILPTINIPEIIAYYYTIKSPNYTFKGEKHNFI